MKKNLIFRLWSDSKVVGEWKDPREARESARLYIEESPEDILQLHLALGQMTREHGFKIITSYRGQELQEYLEDELD